jgi:hypothetical protein
MSLIRVGSGLSYWNRQAMMLGVKIASEMAPSYNLTGMFHLSEHEGRHWGLLSVPNALVRGVFAAMKEPGIELPPGDDGKLNAHITVMRPDEIDMIGGPEALTADRGKHFTYTIGRLATVNPGGWKEMGKAWMLRVHSPELQELRRSYGLSSLPNSGRYDFHITVAVRKSNVLRRNEVSKVSG